MGAEQLIQQAILDALGTQATVVSTRKRRRKDGTVTTYDVHSGDGLYRGNRSLFWRVNSGMARGLGGGMLRLAPPGTADIVGIVNGVPVAFEVKSSVGKQSPEQKLWERLWLDAGGIYAVVRDVMARIRGLISS
jgi:hypothetical protein